MKEKRTFRLPIRIKTLFIIVAFALSLSAVSMVFFSYTISKSNKNHYETIATDISGAISETVAIHPERFNHVKGLIEDKIDEIYENGGEIVFSYDESVADVFKRADEAMYSRKRMMKGK